MIAVRASKVSNVRGNSVSARDNRDVQASKVVVVITALAVAKVAMGREINMVVVRKADNAQARPLQLRRSHPVRFCR